MTRTGRGGRAAAPPRGTDGTPTALRPTPGDRGHRRPVHVRDPFRDVLAEPPLGPDGVSPPLRFPAFVPAGNTIDGMSAALRSSRPRGDRYGGRAQRRPVVSSSPRRRYGDRKRRRRHVGGPAAPCFRGDRYGGREQR
ncbi:hypothetical protein GCM10010358_44700 [Streptomyces minutiscleroticus]|uniref:Uncharacterized protein n=1 Tax=Streptomyces minutiscleroticus TaxID=68238 RepID=A0A918U348_9ACTN|nr:hypothetical protein GCM10010358_44700 [Streptomyces minutiscleroticus]